MRSWNNLLFLGHMPGGIEFNSLSGDFSKWLHEIRENEITTVVCLAPEEQVRTWSPQYHQWRIRLSGTQTHPGQLSLIDIPIDDMRAPDPFVARRFWSAASEVALRCRDGKKTFVHCKAGIGRTGMFAIAVLLSLGYSFEEACQEINETGSFPETAEQVGFLEKGPM